MKIRLALNGYKTKPPSLGLCFFGAKECDFGVEIVLRCAIIKIAK